MLKNLITDFKYIKIKKCVQEKKLSLETKTFLLKYFYQASAGKPNPSGLGCRGKKSDCLIYYIYTSIILKNI